MKMDGIARRWQVVVANGGGVWRSCDVGGGNAATGDVVDVIIGNALVMIITTAAVMSIYFGFRCLYIISRKWLLRPSE
jgi:hypothetical protein